jgi:hypothetical protein
MSPEREMSLVRDLPRGRVDDVLRLEPRCVVFEDPGDRGLREVG